MNPPSAIHGAMSRERKPFTYTPGGLDLSEIKSERMAKRLMRNAMNQGIPELPPQAVQSPTAPSTPLAVPNFNCLPVQVFPTFNLPANPKSLLRTRSVPDQPKEPQISNNRSSGIEHLRDTLISNASTQENKFSNNYRPSSFSEFNVTEKNNGQLNNPSYRSDLYTSPLLPEISYDAEICHTSNQNNKQHIDFGNTSEMVMQPLSERISDPAPVPKPVEENAGSYDDEQKEVKVVKKQVKKEKKVESQNGDQNGDDNAEAEMTVKLPAKKSAAKTETKVEVVKKVLPDGSVEETKTTTTKTTVDGKTEIKTKTETTIIPKEEEEEEEEEVEEEEEEETGEVEENGVEVVTEESKTEVLKSESTEPKETTKIVKQEEKSESTTKKVVVVQEVSQNEDVEEEEEEEEEEEVVEAIPVTVKSPPKQKPQPPPQEQSEQEEVQDKQEEEEIAEVSSKETVEEKSKAQVAKQEKQNEKVEEKTLTEIKSPKKDEVVKSNEEEEELEDEEEYEEAEEVEEKLKPSESKPVEASKQTEEQKDDESEYTEEEIESEKEEVRKESPVAEQKDKQQEEPCKEEPKQDEPKKEEPQVTPTEVKVPLREPSIPLEKVEEVEIKPIGSVSKTHSESTEIKTSTTDKPTGTLSTQTEYNRIENIVTVNRTTRTLDHSYEQLTQQGIPTVKTYFAPDRERVSTSPQPAKPYQPVYPPSQPTERRHSLLLERLSTERQMPSDIYQNSYQTNNQTYEQQRQWSQEPQSEIVNVSNVKPSTITNQQWYQQSRKENVIYNNVLPNAAPTTPAQQWSQPPSQTQQQYQPPYLETQQDISRTHQQNTYPSYSPKPANWSGTNMTSSVNSQTNQYTYLNKDTNESYQKSSQQYSSSYVPPPWEQDPNYVAPEIPTQNYFQPPPSTNTFSPGAKSGWKPAPPPARFSKSAPTSYIPPAPNQSFVKPAEPPKVPGRKTYYSEYERRYITVPESTYIPTEAKFQPQPDPSPQYYYDNNEPTESTEPQWRKELREFTEKTSQTQKITEQTSIKPPWEEDSKYVKVPTVTYNPTPSWSQTLRPQSYRERSFESEFVEYKDWSKTNTLGRGRPLCSYGNSNVEAASTERQRGVSVDRYNPNSYQSPLTTEHAPVQTHTHNPALAPQGKAYHNPNVPAYHARASAEPRDQPAVIPTPRNWGDQRTTPIQSRSFKYLQWITGTED